MLLSEECLFLGSALAHSLKDQARIAITVRLRRVRDRLFTARPLNIFAAFGQK